MAAISERRLDRSKEILTEPSNGLLIVLTGPTGAGKDSVMNELLSYSEQFSRIVTYTSRPMREKEAEGVDYHFVSNEEFEEMIDAGHLLEHVMYGSHYKGTHKESIRQVFEGRDVIWRIDMSRATTVEETLRQAFGEEAQIILERTVVILVGTPTLSDLKERVRSREQEKFDENEFHKRLKADWEIWENNEFPNVVFNEDGKLKEAVDQVLEILETHRSKLNLPQRSS